MQTTPSKQSTNQLAQRLSESLRTKSAQEIDASSHTPLAACRQDRQRVIEIPVDRAGPLHEICAFARRGYELLRRRVGVLPCTRGIGVCPASRPLDLSVQSERVSACLEF